MTVVEVRALERHLHTLLPLPSPAGPLMSLMPPRPRHLHICSKMIHCPKKLRHVNLCELLRPGATYHCNLAVPHQPPQITEDHTTPKPTAGNQKNHGSGSLCLVGVKTQRFSQPWFLTVPTSWQKNRLRALSVEVPHAGNQQRLKKAGGISSFSTSCWRLIPR